MKTLRLLVALFIGLTLLTPSAQAAGTRLEWYGHSAFKLTTPSGKVLLLDPWLTNPKNPMGKADVAALTHVDYILITHGHFDHVGDAAQLARQTGAKLVCTADLAAALVAHGGYPKAQSSQQNEGNFGGMVSLAGGEVKVTFIPAVHSSVVQYEQTEEVPMGGVGGGIPGAVGSRAVTTEQQAFAGNPGGFLITIKGGPTIYDTGDTDLFSDMALIPTTHKVDVMLCCIGDHFTMGPDRAAVAVTLVKPAVVIPIHYGTFPLLTGTPPEFRAALRRHGAATRLKVMQVHETIAL